MGDAAEIITGVQLVGDHYTEQRKYDKDKSKIPVWRTRFNNSMAHLLVEMTAKLMATDKKILHFEQDEMASAITVKQVAGDPYHIYVDNDDAGLLQVYSVLRNDYINVTVDDTTPGGDVEYDVATDATLKTVVTKPDTARVTGMGSASGAYEGVAASAGWTVVSITRYHQMLGYGETDVDTALWDTNTLGHEIFVMGKTNYESGEAGVATAKNLEGVWNYIQRFEQEFEISNYDAVVEQFGESDPFKRVKQLNVEHFMRNVEKALLFQMPSYEEVHGGRILAMMKGLNSIIVDDNRRNITAYSMKNVNEALRPLSDIGAGMDRFLISGSTFVGKLASITESHLQTSPLAQSLGMGIVLKYFEDNFGKRYHVAVSREMCNNLWTNRAFVVNYEYLKYGYLKDNDIQIWKGSDGQGLQSSAAPKGQLKQQIFGEIGLIHSFPESQGLLQFTV